MAVPVDFKVWELFLNKPAMAALTAQLSAQVFKIFLPLFRGKPPDIKQLTNYGDIPSGHTAFIVGVTVAVGLTEGWKSAAFAVAGVVAAIIVYDIIKLRKALEVNLKATDRLLKKTGVKMDEKPPQFRGHSKLEVIAGAVWGAVVAVLFCLFVPKF